MTTELHAAWVWDCDDCGEENFCRAIEGNIDEAALQADENQVCGFLAAPDARPAGVESEDREQLMESECLMQVIVLAPKTVTCNGCGRSFPATLRDDGDAQ